MRLRWPFVVTLAFGAVAACTFIDPLDGLVGGPDGGPPAIADVGPTGETGSPPKKQCAPAPYAGEKITSGFLCGVADCRLHLTGPDCKAVTLADGATETPCTTAFPAEVPGDDVDNDCDGIADEGEPRAVDDAGIQCRGCAFGTWQVRNADGTLQTIGSPNNRAANVNTPLCINSAGCNFGSPQWTRDVAAMPCSIFCERMGGECKEACQTTFQQCSNPEAVKTGLGTYAQDYGCKAPPKDGSAVPVGAPLVGDCKKTFPGLIDPSPDFNYACCCQF